HAFKELIHRLTRIGPGILSLSSGNLLVPMRMPFAALFAPKAHLYYNSIKRDSAPFPEFGYGWEMKPAYGRAPKVSASTRERVSRCAYYSRRENRLATIERPVLYDEHATSCGTEG